MKRNSLLVLAFSSIVLTSCATIFGRSNYPVRIDSNPRDAKVTVTDRKGKTVYEGASPAELKLSSSAGYFKKAIYTVTFEKAGYQPTTVTLNANLNGWYFGNLLIGGALGMLIIDPLTGAMYKMQDLETRPTLLPVDNSSSYLPELKIREIGSIPETMKDKLVKIN